MSDQVRLKSLTSKWSFRKETNPRTLLDFIIRLYIYPILSCNRVQKYSQSEDRQPKHITDRQISVIKPETTKRKAKTHDKKQAMQNFLHFRLWINHCLFKQNHCSLPIGGQNKRIQQLNQRNQTVRTKIPQRLASKNGKTGRQNCRNEQSGTDRPWASCWWGQPGNKWSPWEGDRPWSHQHQTRKEIVWLGSPSNW